MTHTVITFMSATPRETTYQFADDLETYSGMIFGEALLSRRRKEKMPFDRLLLCVTDSLYEELEKFNKGQIDDKKRLPYLEKVKKILNDLENEPDVEILKIKTGRNTNEVWDIFNTVTERIKKEEQVSFDITHGLRSIPFMVFLFAAFLKSAKDVEIKAILYGAAELTDKTTNVAPVIDLTPFVEMLDWINATEFFVKTGNAIRLADLLKSREKSAAQSLEAVSRAALMTQPFSLSKEARNLQRELRKAATSFAYTSQPFSVLAEKISQTFSHFILPEEISRDTPLPCEYGEKLLSQEWDLIEWYQEHGHWMQALTLAREFLIDLVTWEVGDAIDLKPENRNVVERGISGVFRIGRQFRDENGEERLYTESDLNRFGEKFYRKHPRAQEIATVFDTVSTLRNQLNHAEHKKDAIRFSKLIQKIPEELEKVRELYKQRSLIPLTEQENAP